MQLFQIFLPVYNTQKQIFPSHFYTSLATNLTEKFGGLTSYSRSTAEGLWKEENNNTVKDDIIIYEIMVESVEVEWWRNLKKRLIIQFEQEEIIVRYYPINLI